MIELYEHRPAACLEYDPLAPEVGLLISDLILSKSAELEGRSVADEAGSPRRQYVSSGSVESVDNASGPGSVDLVVEHIGSTAVAGCAGKGVIDVMLLYSEGRLEHAKRILDLLGFQRQRTRDPFPESRPMRLGGLSYKGKQYRIHVHVISATSVEAAELRGFRDALRSDPDLRQSYVYRKRAILAAGIVDSVDYSDAKGDFISRVIRYELPPLIE